MDSYASLTDVSSSEMVKNEIMKRKVGRPRKINLIVDENEKGDRKKKVQVEYLKQRYKTDPAFREKCKEYGRSYYRNKKKPSDDISQILS